MIRRKRNVVLTAATVFTIALLPCQVLATPSDQCTVIADLTAEERSAALGEVNVSARGDDIITLQATGMADLESDAVMDATTVIRVASLTKQFTAIAILALQEDGMLNIHDPVGQFLPELPEQWRSITIRQLLSHTSGLTSNMTPVFRQMREDVTTDALIGLFFDQAVIAAPGDIWSYSNLNYWLLGAVIEEITQSTYETFIQVRVLAPAQLEHTQYGHRSEIILHRAQGYEIDQDGCITNARYFSSTIGFAAGGLVSTPADMVQWYAALGRGAVISEALVELALTPVETANGQLSGYGLGWYVSQIDGAVVGHHGGSSIGFTSYVYWSADAKLFAGVFRNWSDGHGEPQHDAERLFRSLLLDHVQ